MDGGIQVVHQFGTDLLLAQYQFDRCARLARIITDDS